MRCCLAQTLHISATPFCVPLRLTPLRTSANFCANRPPCRTGVDYSWPIVSHSAASLFKHPYNISGSSNNTTVASLFYTLSQRRQLKSFFHLKKNPSRKALSFLPEVPSFKSVSSLFCSCGQSCDPPEVLGWTTYIRTVSAFLVNVNCPFNPNAVSPFSDTASSRLTRRPASFCCRTNWNEKSVVY